MIKNGKGGGNTRTGLVFEGKTDLSAFLKLQPHYTVVEHDVFYDDKKVAEVYKKYNFFPNQLVELNQSAKLKFKEFLTLAINKKRSKGYFFASIVLLLSSFLFRMNLYYIISSSVLLVLCLISFLIPQNIVCEDVL